MRTLVFFLVIIAITIRYSESAPKYSHHLHTHTHKFDDDDFDHKKLGAKELIKVAALKSGTALKAKGAAAFAVAKKPFEIAKQVGAGIVAAKAIAIKKVAAAGAAIKAATAIKAGIIAKKALAIKFKPKAKKIGAKLYKLKDKLTLPLIKKKETKTEKVEDGLDLIKSKIAIAAKSVLSGDSQLIGPKIAQPIVASLIGAF